MKTLFANIIWFLSTINNTIAYKLAGANVVKVQKKILFDTLRKNAGSAFGQKHNFANINISVDSNRDGNRWTRFSSGTRNIRFKWNWQYFCTHHKYHGIDEKS